MISRSVNRMETTESRRWRTPHLELVETASAYVVRAEVPGLGPDDLHLTCNSHEVSIHAVRDGDPQDARRYRRRVHFDEAINADGLQASCKNGVLQLDIPKKRSHEPVVVPIQRAGRTRRFLRAPIRLLRSLLRRKP